MKNLLKFLGVAAVLMALFSIGYTAADDIMNFGTGASGTSRFRVDKNGNTTTGGALTVAGITNSGNTTLQQSLALTKVFSMAPGTIYVSSSSTVGPIVSAYVQLVSTGGSVGMTGIPSIRTTVSEGTFLILTSTTTDTF